MRPLKNLLKSEVWIVKKSFRILALPLLSGLLATVAGTSPATAQGYGASAAVGAEDVLVGESLNERAPGYVYVYRKGDGGWSQVQRLAASDAVIGDHFGRALGIAGGDLLVGSTVIDDTRGALYVFRRDGDGNWGEVQKVVAGDGAAGDAFGRTIAAADDIALVAAWGSGESRGAVYVFARGETGEWTEEARLAADDGEPNDMFGFSLATDGEYALVGTPRKNERRGAVYAFRREADRSWTDIGRINMEEAESNTDFGFALAVRHGMAMIGAPGEDLSIGAVRSYLLDEPSGEWRPDALHRPFDGRPGTRFGTTIRHTDLQVWIGAPGAAGFEGRSYVLSWDEDGGEWGNLAKFAAVDLTRGDGMGQVIALGEGFGVAGLQGDDFGAGTALILEEDGGVWRTAVKVASEVTPLEAITGSEVACEDGQANEFTCTDVDIVSFLPVQAIGGSRGVEVNDVWGWTDPVTGTEWALVGRYDGTSFIDLSDPANPVYAGDLPLTEGARPSVWRDIKVYRDHAFIVADGANEHGMQVFDLTQLRDPRNGPVTFQATALYDRIHSAHNIVINEETGFAYAVGSSGGGNTCGGGLHMIDIRDPVGPVFVGCFTDPSRIHNRLRGYSHDAMCVNYRGPDSEHQGKEICFGSNEKAISIADVSDKDAPVALATESYPGVAYSHQGWIDENHEYFYTNDELDELEGTVAGTRTLVWDVKDLDDPILVKQYVSENQSSDHNLYILGDRMYQSNYVSGLRILDISDRENPEEVAYFDTVPWTEDAPGFDGSWSNYPYFRSGIIVVTSGKEGVFFLRNVRRELIP